jgi:alkylation response protein AidB-like acyl-CoA dehydrogenase
MELGLTAEQLDLQQTARSFCDKRFPLDRLSDLERAPLTRSDWAELGSLGVFRLHAPAHDGGLGLGVVDSAVVFEVLGRALVPGPLVWTALAATHLPDIADDAIVGGLADAPATGVSTVVEFADQLDLFVVLRRDGVHVVDPADLRAEPAQPLDPLTPVGVVRDIPTGSRVAGEAVAERMRMEGTALTAALLLGVAERALEAATTYASSRRQFGRAIGSFQAIKHIAADMYVRTSIARSATYAAAALIDDPVAGDPAAASSTASVVAVDAALRNSRACIQVHGGMGFTWEMIPNYLLKRTWVLAHAFGTQADHEERIASRLASEVMASEVTS